MENNELPNVEIGHPVIFVDERRVHTQCIGNVPVRNKLYESCSCIHECTGN